ncbi:2-oxoglutarate dehydrogenase [Staphylococcus microti]|uniref:Dihydrolipoamide acetyltransferase component of pyruvate dehydrogenase complex n=1 Tax=Staphylococcus microti TaxID=569857 RepID=A0A0D6XRW5_9STAP|nr:dihydrolipoamide acetyltransferase family protein [Staphylococcus microti]KIX91549.1 2-oxoglutarate dehydrogenase [Staphylococcus microti]PNZ81007.1 2-oxo acid dehydrogenase subunit E2 [Staphylococcus microti]SUM57574.1 branched-chain alpha-keto aciddehydrogenase complex lipoamide acyltransferase subunit [Staphylococcus microti]
MDIKMPKLGESVHEGTLEQWLVKVGDHVEEYDALCEVITDKVTAEVPSSYAGVITALHVEPGDTVAVGTVICSLDTGEASQADTSDVTGDTVPPDTVAVPETTPNSQPQSNTQAMTNQPKNNGRYSPVVFRIASENGIDLAQVTGTGFEGRVTKKDVELYLKNGQQQAEAPVESSASQPVQSTQVSDTSAQSSHHGQSIPVNGVRRQIANKMVQSVQEIPHAWMKVEVDATELVATRNHHKASFKSQEGYNLTYFAFFVKAVAEALKKYPMLNSSWQGDEIIVHDEINLSIAVAHEDKLFVPVIRNADDKSIKGIVKDIHALAQKARNNQLSTADMSGGTFTVNNTGTFGSVSSMGIINHPQAAILQVESIVKRPVVINDMLAIRHMVNLCLSIDHRILDGLQAGQFLNEVKKRIEQYTLDNTSIY